MADLLSLSHGPTKYVTSFTGYIVNGFKFYVERRDNNLSTQNSGVVVIGNTGNEVDSIDYYAVLKDVIVTIPRGE